MKYTIEDMLTEQSIVRCALADLIGAYQAIVEHNDPSVHDWSAHAETIHELYHCFPFLQDDPLPELTPYIDFND